MFSNKVVNFKDFSRPNKGIKYLNRIQGLFKTATKTHDLFKIVRTMLFFVIVVCSNFQTKNLLLTMTVSLSTPSSSSRVRVGRLSSGSASAEALTDCSDSLLS